MNNELYHHGILGQKWGIRRYQNADGTWTEEGKRRYGTGKKSASEMTTEELRRAVNRGNMERRYKQLTSNRAGDSDRLINSTFNTANRFLKVEKTAREERYKKEGRSSKEARKAAREDLQDWEDASNDSRTVASTLNKIFRRSKKYTVNGKEVFDLSDEELRRALERLELEEQYNNLNRTSVKQGMDVAADVLDTIGDVLVIGGAIYGAGKYVGNNWSKMTNIFRKVTGIG